MSDYPIIPPPELVQEWRKSGPADAAVNNAYECHIATCAAQWGADQQLEACCEWLEEIGPSGVQLWGDDLRKDCRPKPPSLKEQALQALSEAVKMADDVPPEGICSDQANIIRRALEALPE
jgi:hypothetical protein